jgi:hypothetical protein
MTQGPMPAIKTGPNPQDFAFIDPQQLESMPIAQYYRDYQGRIVNAQSGFYYDSAYIKAGTAVAANARQALFTKGKTQDTTQFNDAATVIGEKGVFMTNMVADGQFDNGTTFIMEGAGVQIVETADLPATIGTRGEITGPNYTASVVISGVNNLLAALNNLNLQFIRGEDVKKQGPLLFWPAPPGIGLEGASGSPNGGFFQNGRGGLVQFSHPVVLQSLDKFSFNLENIALQAWTPTLPLLIRVVLWGQVIKTFQPG